MPGTAMTRADDHRLTQLLEELRALQSKDPDRDLKELTRKLRAISRRFLPSSSGLRDGIDSEDLAHEGMLTLIQHVDEFRGETMGEFLAFAKAIVNQQAVRQARWQQVRRGELGRQAAAEDHALEERTPSADAVLEEDKRKLRQLLAALSSEYREPLRLRMEGLDNAGIAAELGLREDLVRKRLSRALRALQRKW